MTMTGAGEPRAGEHRDVTLTMTLDAPPGRVFEAWTDPKHLDWFFSDMTPPGEPVAVDLRVGGQWRQRMIVAADTEYVTGGVYEQIVPAEKLAFYWGATDGWPRIDLDHPEDSQLVTVTLGPTGVERTEMVFHIVLPEEWSAEDMRVCRQGWSETLGRLVKKLSGD